MAGHFGELWVSGVMAECDDAGRMINKRGAQPYQSPTTYIREKNI
jgi:hypothetical protein